VTTEGRGPGEVPRARRAALAPNWRTVLAVDAAVGLALVVIGLVTALRINVLGLVLVVGGSAYIALVSQRARQWRRWRDEAGLD
jgi:hypothetical protein